MIRSHQRTTAPDFHVETVRTDTHVIVFHIPPKGKGNPSVVWRRNGSVRSHTFSRPRLNDVKAYFHSTMKVLALNVPTTQEWS